jgi:E3 ubiquitin-protein ligase HERC4
LGLGDCDNRDVPEEVEALSEHKITDVCGGVDFCVFRTDKGELFTSGSNAFGQLGLGHNQDVDLPQLVPDIIAKKVCCGAHHCVALIDAKTIYSWGQNNHYQLGHGNNKNMNTPTRITTKLPHKIMNIYAGMNHTIILVEYGFVFTCGLGTSGQLGHGDTRYRTIPILLKSHRMTSIYCNSLANHWFGISNGKLFGVGSNAKGQLIMYNSTIRCGVPTELNVSGNVLDIGLGSEHSVVILEKHKPLVKNMHAFRDIDIITLTEYL